MPAEDIPFQTRATPEGVDTLAPDGSEIRLLTQVRGGSLVHCTLPPGGVSLAVTHRTVEELWFVLEGQGELWRRQRERESIDALVPGVSASIPLGTHFQFRNIGDAPLCMVIVTMPPWPGADEAVRVADHWPTA
jgi:mannose-6-phosphate isomerase-like protein (cupin superfamily)